MLILGIETSCDDTGIALINKTSVLANVVLKQEHKSGVIPEYAARAHHEALFENAKQIIENQKIELVAYANSPGLIGSLFVGSSFAKGLAYSLRCQLMGINHIEAHILLPFWLEKINQQEIPLPCLSLIISGGHTMLILIKKIGQYVVLANTLDDAVGEVFDKVARHIGLKYPGGPEIENLAKNATNETQFKFPKVMLNNDNFSFSGLKTAAIIQINNKASCEKKADFCWQFQSHIAILLGEKFERIHKKIGNICSWIISGGVASNETIKNHINEIAKKNNIQVFYPPTNLCSDNGLMIAATASLKWKGSVYNFDLQPKATSQINNI